MEGWKLLQSPAGEDVSAQASHSPLAAWPVALRQAPVAAPHWTTREVGVQSEHIQWEASSSHRGGWARGEPTASQHNQALDALLSWEVVRDGTGGGLGPGGSVCPASKQWGKGKEALQTCWTPSLR